jgi:AraC-like DNA-binding protein
MHAKREIVQPDLNSSFRLIVTPHLERVFYWHYHPEYELVYIEGTDGNRHIGDHLSRYTGNDLAFIGPYIPHLNFDYGAGRDHIKIVVQLREDFLGADFLKKPELSDIRQLFSRADGAICFSGETKNLVGERLKRLPSVDHFQQLMILLDVFQILAKSPEFQQITAQPIASEQDFRGQQRLKNIQQFVAEHYRDPLDMPAIIALAQLSNAAFCRYFKKATGQTFTEYLNQYRIQQARQLLLKNSTVTEACFGSGFENLSHFNKTFKKIAGENPLQFKKRSLSGLSRAIGGL